MKNDDKNKIEEQKEIIGCIVAGDELEPESEGDLEEKAQIASLENKKLIKEFEIASKEATKSIDEELSPSSLVCRGAR